ncbi:MAG: fatty acid hydroxylase [Proteobacteria bacterium]|nr:fatty acid hydroxylase [Pseudomonadota bacterium]
MRLKIMFSHLSVQLMAAAILIGVLVVCLTGPAWVWLLVPLGVLVQMLNEYSIHRYLFHLPAPKKQWLFDLLYQVHYGHHDFPTNKGLFFVPAWFAIPMLCINFTLLWFALSFITSLALPVAAIIILVGGVGTFLFYEWFHMTAHLNVPKVWVERHVTTLHNQHHFRDFSKWFHVSPGGHVIDRLMGTAINHEALKQQQRMEFIRTMGLRPDDPRLVAARLRFADKYGFTKVEIERAAVV